MTRTKPYNYVPANDLVLARETYLSDSMLLEYKMEQNLFPLIQSIQDLKIVNIDTNCYIVNHERELRYACNY